MNNERKIYYEFPIYTERYIDPELSADEYTKFIDIINFYKQLYLKTDYKCEKEMVQFMTLVAQFIYLYNGEELFDSGIIFDSSKGIYLEKFKQIFDRMPKIICGYKMPGYDSESKKLEQFNIARPIFEIREENKLINRMDEAMIKFLLDIFKNFAGYSYYELLPYMKGMNIYKSNVHTNLYISNNSKNIYYRVILAKSIQKGDVKAYLKDSDNLIENFICNYNFSSIKALNKMNDIEQKAKLKVRKYIDNATN